MNYLIMFIGAGTGGMLRYRLDGLIQASAGSALPWGTLAINVSGSFALGLVYGLLDQESAAPWRLLLGGGLCGGYTTFSAFSHETLLLIQDGRVGRAGLYIGASMMLGILGAWLGMRLTGVGLSRT